MFTKLMFMGFLESGKRCVQEGIFKKNLSSPPTYFDQTNPGIY